LALKGLLVDFGGVLTTNVFESFEAFCRAEGLAPERVRDAFMGDPVARDLLFELELGRVSEADFEQRFGTFLELAEPVGLIERLFGGMRPDHAMRNAVRAFRDKGVRTGLISNSWGAATYDRDELALLFDGVVISGDEAIRKPDPAIYVLGAERIGLTPQDCVFVDDLRGNLKPARALGMATVHHVDAAQTVAELQDLLGVKLA